MQFMPLSAIALTIAFVQLPLSHAHSPSPDPCSHALTTGEIPIVSVHKIDNAERKRIALHYLKPGQKIRVKAAFDMPNLADTIEKFRRTLEVSSYDFDRAHLESSYFLSRTSDGKKALLWLNMNLTAEQFASAEKLEHLTSLSITDIVGKANVSIEPPFTRPDDKNFSNLSTSQLLDLVIPRYSEDSAETKPGFDNLRNMLDVGEIAVRASIYRTQLEQLRPWLNQELVSVDVLKSQPVKNYHLPLDNYRSPLEIVDFQASGNFRAILELLLRIEGLDHQTLRVPDGVNKTIVLQKAYPHQSLNMSFGLPAMTRTLFEELQNKQLNAEKMRYEIRLITSENSENVFASILKKLVALKSETILKKLHRSARPITTVEQFIRHYGKKNIVPLTQQASSALFGKYPLRPVLQIKNETGIFLVRNRNGDFKEIEGTGHQPFGSPPNSLVEIRTETKTTIDGETLIKTETKTYNREDIFFIARTTQPVQFKIISSSLSPLNPEFLFNDSVEHQWLLIESDLETMSKIQQIGRNEIFEIDVAKPFRLRNWF